MLSLEKSIAVLSSKESYENLGATDNDVVTSMEDALGISFSDEYRHFIISYGYISWFGHSILGYSPNDVDYDTVYATNKMRKAKYTDGFNPIPHEGNIVMKYAGGGYYFLWAKHSAFEGKIILYTDDMAGNAVREWQSFCDFVEYLTQF